MKITAACLIVIGCLMLAMVMVGRESGVLGGGGAGHRRTMLRVADWGGPATDPAFLATEREISQEFEALHPQVRIEVEHIPGPGQYVPKLAMMFVAGDAPDVIQLDGASAAIFMDNGLLADLEPQIKADGAFALGDYYPTLVDIARRGKHLYAIPLDFTPVVVMYNKTLFDKAGEKYPPPGWTRQEFLQAAKRLTGANHDPATAGRYGFVFSEEMPLWIPWIWSNGGDVLSPDGRRAEGYLDGPASIEALQFLDGLVNSWHVSPNPRAVESGGIDLFRAGKAAMTITGHWSLVEYRQDHLPIGVSSVPSHQGHNTTILYESGLAISRDCRIESMAWEYIKFMTGQKIQQRRAATGVAISARRAVAESFGDDPVERAFLEQIPYARIPWGAKIQGDQLLQDAARQMMDDILNRRSSVGQAASLAAKIVDAQLARQ